MIVDAGESVCLEGWQSCRRCRMSSFPLVVQRSSVVQRSWSNGMELRLFWPRCHAFDLFGMTCTLWMNDCRAFGLFFAERSTSFFLTSALTCTLWVKDPALSFRFLFLLKLRFLSSLLRPDLHLETIIIIVWNRR